MPAPSEIQQSPFLKQLPTRLPPLEPRTTRAPVPLIPMQRLYWRALVEQGSFLSQFRNCAASLLLSGTLEVADVEGSIRKAITRHESLRARVSVFNQEPHLVSDLHTAFELHAVDLSSLTARTSEDAAREFGTQFLSTKVDIREGPLFDAKLLKLSPENHVLLLALDHIVSDATSYSILTREVLSCLANESAQHQVDVPAPRLQFFDYAAWHDRTREAWRKYHEPYWRNRLSNLPKLTIPTDLDPRSDKCPPCNFLHVPFGKRLTDALRAAAQRERCLMPLVVLSLYLIAMSKWCDQNDLLVHFVSHGRHGHIELKDMIGCLAYPIPLRIELVRKESIRDLLGRITAELHSAFANDASRVFGSDLLPGDWAELCFNWLPSGWGLSGAYPAEEAHNRLKIKQFPITKEEVTAKFAPLFMDTPSGMLLVVPYNAERYLRSTVERFASQLRWLAETFVQSPASELASLDFRG